MGHLNNGITGCLYVYSGTAGSKSYIQIPYVTRTVVSLGSPLVSGPYEISVPISLFCPNRVTYSGLSEPTSHLLFSLDVAHILSGSEISIPWRSWAQGLFLFMAYL